MNMHKFAHMSDCHIGAWRDEKLRDLNLQAFEKAIDLCVEEKVDFILISGDLFDSNIPDLYQVKRSVEKLRLAKDKGINVYLIFGSHDYSPNTISMIDVLESADLFEKVSKAEFEEDKLELQFVEDPKTGAKLTGLPGRKMGLEKDYYETLDVEPLEKEEGFKIFQFHTSVTELNPGYIPEAHCVPLSLLPRSFDYYAGGNIHKKIEGKFTDYPIVTYPGSLFGTDFRDLEDMAQGERRGFFIVEFDGAVGNVKFVEVNISDVVYHLFDADRKTPRQVEELLVEKAKDIDVENKIVLFRVAGMMSAGRSVDIDFRRIKEILLERGAVYANINRYAIKSKERIEVKVKGERKAEIEERIFKEKMSGFKIDPSIKSKKIRRLLESRLVGEKGVELARNLLDALKIEKKEGETKADFHARVLHNALEVTQLEDEE
jgi:exonuclease SbcD